MGSSPLAISRGLASMMSAHPLISETGAAWRPFSTEVPLGFNIKEASPEALIKALKVKAASVTVESGESLLRTHLDYVFEDGQPTSDYSGILGAMSTFKGIRGGSYYVRAYKKTGVKHPAFMIAVIGISGKDYLFGLRSFVVET